MEEHEVAALEQAIAEYWDRARALGLDPLPVHFELVPAPILYEIGAYLLPGRFNHWSFGKAYWLMKTQYDYGLSKIYELVINADPALAFLLETNTLTQNKFVAAHVLGHSDFFKHNVWFQRTDRDMVDLAAEHARRIREYTLEVGAREVEAFLDAALALADHVDPFPRREPPQKPPAPRPPGEFDDLFPQPQRPALPRGRGARKVPPEPDSDLLRFLIDHGDHLEDWQRDCLAIVRSEALYFLPQRMTKIMNEGWATFWHLRILREATASDREFTDFARLHAAVATPGGVRLNPYHVGLKIWEDIERRYGREHLFAVRDVENDASFVRLYLTEELVRDLDLFLFQLEKDEWKVASKDWQAVRDTLAHMLACPVPHIVVEDGDWRGRRELYLKHHHDGRNLDLPLAEKTLQHLYRIWQRPVHLETVVDGRTLVLTADADRVVRQPQ